LKIYCVFDTQFKSFSDPFLSADDSAAEKLMVQTALLTEGFRKRVFFHDLYSIGSFDPATSSEKMPMHAFKRPELVLGGDRLAHLVEQCENAQKAYRSNVCSSASVVKEVSDNE
jgi:hypothetical protein